MIQEAVSPKGKSIKVTFELPPRWRTTVLLSSMTLMIGIRRRRWGRRWG